jgi:hypothetical protein
MPALVAGINVSSRESKTWMAGQSRIKSGDSQDVEGAAITAWVGINLTA